MRPTGGGDSVGNEVGKNATALCYPGGILCLQASGAYFLTTDFSPSFAMRTVVFLYPFFSSDRKEMAAMTMPKRETNSVWSRVREDRDIDDLIFDYDAYRAGEDDTSSDR